MDVIGDRARGTGLSHGGLACPCAVWRCPPPGFATMHASRKESGHTRKVLLAQHLSLLRISLPCPNHSPCLC